MVKILLVVTMVCASLGAEAQFSRLIVQLADKNNSPYSIGQPQQYLSARAIARRTRFNIPVDSSDLPVSPDYINMVKAQGAVQVLSQSKWLNQILIRCSDSLAIQQIRSLPFVKGVNSMAPVPPPVDTAVQRKQDPELPLTGIADGATSTQADVYSYGNSYNQVHMHLGEFLHNKGLSGQGMMITILDAGFNNYRTNTAFDSVRLQGHVLGERDFVAFDNSVAEDDTHGKNCFSIIAANWPGRMVGSATKADFWLVRTEDAATEYPVEEHNWVVGAEFADSCGSDLITSSLGYTTFDNPVFNHTYNDFYTNSTMITQGASLAVRKGMIVTNSAGNDGTAAWRYLGFPADADSVCAVGSVNSAGTISSFSSYGYAGKQKPNVVSQGTATVIAGTTGPTTGNGTSYSNPNMAGLITCLWQAFPAFNNMKILNALYASGNRAAAPDNRYGFGVPNMKTAYRSLKKEQNVSLYGNDWLWLGAGTFVDTLGVRYIGQVDGSARLELLDAGQNVLQSYGFTAEVEEVVNYTFTNLNTLPNGVYTLKYADSLTTRSMTAVKSAVLPFTLLAVNARWAGNDAVIEWSAATTGAGYFNIQKSTSGSSFVTLATLPVSGLAGSTGNYRYSDPNAKDANAPDVYYRIELVDKDQRKVFSNICRLPKLVSGNRMVLYPNPARDHVQLSVNTTLQETARLQLINTRGQVVQSRQVQLAGGSNTLNVSLAGIPAGSYTVTVTTNTQTFRNIIIIDR